MFRARLALWLSGLLVPAFALAHSVNVHLIAQVDSSSSSSVTSSSSSSVTSSSSSSSSVTSSSSSSVTSSSSSSPSLSGKAAVLACLKTAVGKREGALQAAFAQFTASMTSALKTRGDALKAAYDIQNDKDRAQAIKKANSDFHKAQKDAAKTYRTARDAARKQYKADKKACHGKATKSQKVKEDDDDSNISVDINL